MNGKVLAPDFAAAVDAKAERGDDVPLVEEFAPIIEIIIPSALSGVTTPAYHFKVWGDGRVEGFDKLSAGWSKRMTVVNRVPALLREITGAVTERAGDIHAAIALLNDLAEYVDAADAGIALLAGEAKLGEKPKGEGDDESQGGI